MERILAIQIKRIGDLILTAPALTRLRQARPDARITLVTMGAAGQLVPAIPAVDTHFSYRYRRPNLRMWGSLLLDRYDTVLDFNGTDRSAFMTWLTGADRRVTYAKRARGPWRERTYTHTSGAKLRPLHTVDHMGALLDAIGVPADGGPTPLSLDIPGPVQAGVDDLLARHGLEGPFAVIHPGTARPEKYWKAERWAEVIRECTGGPRRLPCVITGGNDPDETRHLSAILAALDSGHTGGVGAPLMLAGKLSLLETAAVIRRADLALGVDTAAMHLASAFEVPQVVLFGPTNPYHWRPRHPDARILLAGHDGVMTEADYTMRLEERSMDAISAAQVIDAIASLPAGGAALTR